MDIVFSAFYIFNLSLVILAINNHRIIQFIKFKTEYTYISVLYNKKISTSIIQSAKSEILLIFLFIVNPLILFCNSNIYFFVQNQ